MHGDESDLPAAEENSWGDRNILHLFGITIMSDTSDFLCIMDSFYFMKIIVNKFDLKIYCIYF